MPLINATLPDGPLVTGRHRRRSRGQALVEFAVVIPVFLAMLFGIVDLGRVVWANNSLANAAREAARFAIVHGGTESNPCPVGPMTRVPPGPGATCPYPSPSKQAVIDVAKGFALAGGRSLTVDVCYGDPCTGSIDKVGAVNTRGTAVTVTVTSAIDILTGSFVGRGSFTVRGSATMLINY